MGKVTIELYDSKHEDAMQEMLEGFSRDIYGEGVANVKTFIDAHWFTYLAIQDGEPIGFSSYIYNDYCGLRSPVLGNTFLYIKEPYRRGRAAYLLTKQTGYVCMDVGLPLELYIASDESDLITKAVGIEGEKLYTAYEYPLPEIQKRYSYYKK